MLPKNARSSYDILPSCLPQCFTVIGLNCKICHPPINSLHPSVVWHSHPISRRLSFSRRCMGFCYRSWGIGCLTASLEPSCWEAHLPMELNGNSNRIFGVPACRLLIIFHFCRIIVFSLRAVESRTPSMRKETEVNAYFQLTFAIGSTIICMDVVNLLRAALVNTTLKSSRRKSEVPLSFEATSGSSTQTVSTFQVQEEYSAEEDKPSERYWYRRLSDLLSVGFFSALVLGVVASSLYSGATMMEHTTVVFRLR